MVANYRCNELKDESIEKIKEENFLLKEESERGVVQNFSKRCEQIIKLAIDHYDEFAH